MPSPGIQIEGLDELRRELRRIKDTGLNDQLKATNRKLADEIIAKALPDVPVKTGRLKASVRGLGNLSGALGKAGGSGVPYAAAIHWGRRRGGFIPPRPFLRNAARTVERTVIDTYRNDIDSVFDAIR